MAYPKLTPIVATGATEPRYLGDRFADFVNVRDYGAKGDGISDDTAAFQSAVATGFDVFVPKGTYYIASSVSGSFYASHDAIFNNVAPSIVPLYKTQCPKNISFYISKDGSDIIKNARTKGLSSDEAFLTFDEAFRFFKTYYEVVDPTTTCNFNFGAGDFGDIYISNTPPGCTFRIFGADADHSTIFHEINLSSAGVVYIGNLAFSCIEMRQVTLWGVLNLGVIYDERHTKYCVATGGPGTDFILFGTATLTFLESVSYSVAPFYCSCELRDGATISGASNVTSPYKYKATDNEVVNCATSVYVQMTWSNNYFVASDSCSIQSLIAKDLLHNKGTGGAIVATGNNYAIFANGLAICYGIQMFSNSTTANVTLPISYSSNTAYLVILSPRSTVAFKGPSNSEKTASSFTIACSTTTSAGVDWLTIGYTNGL